MFKLTLAVAAAIACFWFSSRAQAADAPPAAAPSVTDKEAPSRVSLTLDPTRPLVGMWMVNGEVRLPHTAMFPRKDVSVGGWIGIGHMRKSDGQRFVWQDCGDACERATAVWVGGQALLYPVGTFEHGMQLGVEASVMHLEVTRQYREWSGVRPPDERSSGTAFIPGLTIGYKLVTKSGFTFNPQLACAVMITTDAEVAFAPLPSQLLELPAERQLRPCTESRTCSPPSAAVSRAACQRPTPRPH